MFRPDSKRRIRSARRTAIAKQRSRRHSLHLESLEPRMLLTGTWTQLANLPPVEGIPRLVLGLDGSVMIPQAVHPSVADTSQKLTPDASGSYVNGTWSAFAHESIQRARSTTTLFPDGRILELGGTTNNIYLNTGEIYDPRTDTWTSIAPFPESTFGNGPTMLLADGRLLAGSIQGPQTYIYDPHNDSWSAGPTKLFGDSNLHEAWTLLSDGSVLSYDVNSNRGEAQRMDPTTMTWIDSGTVPVALEAGVSAYLNMGPGMLLPDGRVLQLGRSSQTAIYTPSATPGGTGTWDAGPVIPNGLETGGSNSNSGSTAAMLPNGHVMFVADKPDTGGPTRFFEWDPTATLATSLSDVTPPVTEFQTASAALNTRLLVLPTGQVMMGYDHSTNLAEANRVFVYTPDGAPQAAWKPTISSIVANGNHYTLTGTQLNGLSAGSTTSVSTESANNHPVVELKDGSGKVYFATTSNWSSTGVTTGSTPVTTDFTVPVYVPYGAYSLCVIANGIASDAVSFTGGFQGTSADLALSYEAPSISTEGNNITFTLTVKNNGPTDATGVVLSDTLGANLKYVSATNSQGTFTQTGSMVNFTFGPIAVGQTATATITAQALEDGNLTNTASVTGSVFDADLSNNSVVIPVGVAEAPINVSSPISVKGKSVSNQLVATFTHANGLESASAFVATINWGDGSTSTGTVTLSGTTYSVKGSHTWVSANSHTITTTVVEASGGGGAMSALALVTSSTPTNSNDNAPVATQAPPAEADGNPPRLPRNVVDQLLSTATVTRSRSLLHATVNDAALDDLFALS